VEQLVIGYRSSQVPRKEYCRLHGIGLSTLDRYLHQWQKRQSHGGKEVPAEGRLVAVELASAASIPVRRSKSVPAQPVDTKSSEAMARPSGLTVCLSGQRWIEVQRGFDVSVLKQLVELLERV
jgi:transposase-like protein